MTKTICFGSHKIVFFSFQEKALLLNQEIHCIRNGLQLLYKPHEISARHTLWQVTIDRHDRYLRPVTFHAAHHVACKPVFAVSVVHDIALSSPFTEVLGGWEFGAWQTPLSGQTYNFNKLRLRWRLFLCPCVTAIVIG